MKAQETYIKIVGEIVLSNGHRNGETPEPIPNSEAKPVHDVKYCSTEWERALPFGFMLMLGLRLHW